MYKRVDTGKTRIEKVFINEYYCDECGAKLDKDNHKLKYWSSEGVKHVCLKSPVCNPFHKDLKGGNN